MFSSDTGSPVHVRPSGFFYAAENKIIILCSVKFLPETSDFLQYSSDNKKMADIVVGTQKVQVKIRFQMWLKMLVQFCCNLIFICINTHLPPDDPPVFAISYRALGASRSSWSRSPTNSPFVIANAAFVFSAMPRFLEIAESLPGILLSLIVYLPVLPAFPHLQDFHLRYRVPSSEYV